ncbi:hypothetical protein CC78DRAFT_282832 [Lojkania enalia]|uniref:Uncharacterized protein n=1 Tax=Lojkania enalia TaxID=147567 RepID=A0A9P4NAE9_9PLEO|nr:hypothetical protein CC78DRAFT_282832 [Didymosphaeria enalia]
MDKMDEPASPFAAHDKTNPHGNHTHPSPADVTFTTHVLDLFNADLSLDLRGLPGSDHVKDSDVYCPEVRRSKRSSRRTFDHLDVVSCWKNLSPKQTAEIREWEVVFKLALEDMVLDVLLGAFVAQLRESNERINEKSVIPEFSRFITKINRRIDIDVPRLVYDMLDEFYERQVTSKYDWFVSSGNLPGEVYKFLQTRDCFFDGFPLPSIEVDFILEQDRYRLSVIGNVKWGPPEIEFQDLPASLCPGEEYRVMPLYRDPDLGSSLGPRFISAPAQTVFYVKSAMIPLAWDGRAGAFRAIVPNPQRRMDPITRQRGILLEQGNDIQEENFVQGTTSTFQAGIVRYFPGNVRFEQTTRYSIELNIDLRARINTSTPRFSVPICEQEFPLIRVENVNDTEKAPKRSGSPCLEPFLEASRPGPQARTSSWLPSYSSTPASKCRRADSSNGQLENRKDGRTDGLRSPSPIKSDEPCILLGWDNSQSSSFDDDAAEGWRPHISRYNNWHPDHADNDEMQLEKHWFTHGINKCDKRLRSQGSCQTQYDSPKANCEPSSEERVKTAADILQYDDLPAPREEATYAAPQTHEKIDCLDSLRDHFFRDRSTTLLGNTQTTEPLSMLRIGAEDDSKMASRQHNVPQKRKAAERARTTAIKEAPSPVEIQSFPLGKIDDLNLELAAKRQRVGTRIDSGIGLLEPEVILSDDDHEITIGLGITTGSLGEAISSSPTRNWRTGWYKKLKDGRSEACKPRETSQASPKRLPAYKRAILPRRKGSLNTAFGSTENSSVSSANNSPVLENGPAMFKEVEGAKASPAPGAKEDAQPSDKSPELSEGPRKEDNIKPLVLDQEAIRQNYKEFLKKKEEDSQAKGVDDERKAMESILQADSSEDMDTSGSWNTEDDSRSSRTEIPGSNYSALLD